MENNYRLIEINLTRNSVQPVASTAGHLQRILLGPDYLFDLPVCP